MEIRKKQVTKAGFKASIKGMKERKQWKGDEIIYGVNKDRERKRQGEKMMIIVMNAGRKTEKELKGKISEGRCVGNTLMTKATINAEKELKKWGKKENGVLLMAWRAAKKGKKGKSEERF